MQAMREGHWLILDELNLAPTDVLEALNRVRIIMYIINMNSLSGICLSYKRINFILGNCSILHW